MAGGRNKGKAKVQQPLTGAGLLPLLKKPHATVGKVINLPGKAWGSACPPADVNKIFKTTIMDHSLAHRDEEDGTPYEALQLQEMGQDGSGGNSLLFWMKYPIPFLQYYYDTFPDELQATKAQAVHDAAATTPQTAGGQETPAEESGPATKTGIYQHLDFIKTETVNGRTRSCFTCRINKCGGSVTIFGKSTGPFFKHVRRRAKRGDEAHAKVLDEVNELSCRQVQLPSGEFVTVYTFEECFPYHVGFMWLVAGGMAMKLNRRPIFKDYVRRLEPRIVLPHNETVHRLAEITDELQIKHNRMARHMHIRSFQGLPCVGLQMDLWTDRNSGIAYAAVHSSIVTLPTSSDADALELLGELLHFKAFPFTSHTSQNIKAWLVQVLLEEEMPATVITGVTPDGASDGQSGVKSVPGLFNKVDVCELHDLQRVVLYGIGKAGPKASCPNQDARDLLSINGRVVQLAHQSREVSDGFRKFQKDNNIRANKVISVVRTNATRWTNQKKQITRNNHMRPIIDPVLSIYRREHATDTAIIEKVSSDDDSDGDTPRGPFTQVSAKAMRCDAIRYPPPHPPLCALCHGKLPCGAH